MVSSHFPRTEMVCGVWCCSCHKPCALGGANTPKSQDWSWKSQPRDPRPLTSLHQQEAPPSSLILTSSHKRDLIRIIGLIAPYFGGAQKVFLFCVRKKPLDVSMIGLESANGFGLHSGCFMEVGGLSLTQRSSGGYQKYCHLQTS